MISSLPTPGVLPVWEGERLSVGEAMAWFRSARPCLRPDWVALVDGAVPRSLIKYTPRVVPAALVIAPVAAPGAPLVADTGNPAQVSARDALIAQVTEENLIRATERDAHEAELKYELFMALDSSLRSHAPLLLSYLKTTFHWRTTQLGLMVLWRTTICTSHSPVPTLLRCAPRTPTSRKLVYCSGRHVCL